MNSSSTDISCRSDLQGLNITIMGLGLHGGGIASAAFLAESGAKLTVTDLRSTEILSGSVARLKNYDIRYVLGEHRESDFTDADIVIKNPGVPSTSPYLKLCRSVETDISIFLRLCSNPVLAITGSKGKSTTVSALYHILNAGPEKAFLGGNITVSPLTFLEQAAETPQTPVILELSSWQLHDLPSGLTFNPKVSMITNIMKDHQNSYNSMNEYVADKEIIYAGQSSHNAAIFNYDDPYTKEFSAPCAAGKYYISSGALPEGLYGAWQNGQTGFIHDKNGQAEIDLKNPHMPGQHNQRNLLQAALAARLAGADMQLVSRQVLSFKGIPHRLEKLDSDTNYAIYNDSAATIPDATAAAVNSFSEDIVLITGGTDKEIDFSVVATYASVPVHTVFLEGSATEKMIPFFKKAGSSFSGPFDNLEKTVQTARSHCSSGSILLFSPGATSFGMFLNEFDRGDKFKALFR